jgi:hypothetical protein
LPFPAALAPWLRIKAPQLTRTTADSTTARLYPLLIFLLAKAKINL